MTIRYPDCPKCRNSGRIREAVLNEEIDFLFHPQELPLSMPSFTTREVEVACDCIYGREWTIFMDRMNHPEYRNPFAKMTDEEIFKVLNDTSDNAKAVDQEFDV